MFPSGGVVDATPHRCIFGYRHHLSPGKWAHGRIIFLNSCAVGTKAYEEDQICEVMDLLVINDVAPAAPRVPEEANPSWLVNPRRIRRTACSYPIIPIRLYELETSLET
jgi:hypothetical protein